MPSAASQRSARPSSSPGSPEQVVVTDSLDEHAGAWDALAAAAPLPSPFLRSWWLAHMPAVQPAYVLVFGADGLLGGLALDRKQIAPVPVWRHLGSALVPDHLDLIARPAREAEVVDALRRWLRRPGSRLLELDGLAEGASLLRALPRPRTIRSDDVAPYFRLPSADLEEYLRGRPGRLRSSVERPRKRLQDKLGVIHRSVPAHDIDRGLHKFRVLHLERWGPDAPLLQAWPAFSAAAAAGIRCGELRLHELVAPACETSPEQVIAMDALFVIGNRVSIYAGGRSTAPAWRGAGTLLMWAEMAALVTHDGAREFDFLRGDEPYKHDWADSARSVLVARTAHGPRGLAALARREGPRLLRNRLRPLARRMGRAGR